MTDISDLKSIKKLLGLKSTKTMSGLELTDEEVLFSDKYKELSKSEDGLGYALKMRRIYGDYFKPNGKNILLLNGFADGDLYSPSKHMPDPFHHLDDSFKADGANILASFSEAPKNIEELFEKADSFVFRGDAICNRGQHETAGYQQFGLFHQAEKLGKDLLFFLNSGPMYSYCSTDWEFETARKLNKEGKNVHIIAADPIGNGWQVRHSL